MIIMGYLVMASVVAASLYWTEFEWWAMALTLLGVWIGFLCARGLLRLLGRWATWRVNADGFVATTGWLCFKRIRQFELSDLERMRIHSQVYGT